MTFHRLGDIVVLLMHFVHAAFLLYQTLFSKTPLFKCNIFALFSTMTVKSFLLSDRASANLKVPFQTNKQANKQTNKQVSKQASKQTNKQTNKYKIQKPNRNKTKQNKNKNKTLQKWPKCHTLCFTL